MGSEAINSVFGKKLIDEGIKQIPNIYKYMTSKIKNKNVQRALNSNLTNIVVDKTQNRAKKQLINLFGGAKKKKKKKKMAKEISNFQIENALENINDENINDNFVDVFPSNHMNKFINHAAMISEKKENTPSL